MLLVGDERREWNGSEIHLFSSHFNELWDGNSDRARYPLEVGCGGRFVPFEEIRIVDEILHHEIFRIPQIGGGVYDLVERGDGRPENVEEGKGDVALLRCLDEPDVAQRVQRWRQQAGSHIDQADSGISRIDRVEDPHLVRDVIDIDDIGHVRVEALQRASWYFGVECANAQLLGAK